MNISNSLPMPKDCVDCPAVNVCNGAAVSYGDNRCKDLFVQINIFIKNNSRLVSVSQLSEHRTIPLDCKGVSMETGLGKVTHYLI